VPVAWGSIEGVILTTALLAAAIVLTLFLGTGGKPASPEALYFTGTINRENRLLHWHTSLGIVIVMFSLVAAAAFVFSFIAV
jgi:hypothetical protein